MDQISEGGHLGDEVGDDLLGFFGFYRLALTDLLPEEVRLIDQGHQKVAALSLIGNSRRA
jgi:hypothetical protein